MAANCQAILRLASAGRETCLTSAEVLQEVLHVLLRQNQSTRVLLAIRLATQAVDVVPLTVEEVIAAAETPVPAGLSARDRIHLATMRHYGITNIISADRAFDDVPGITRLDPARLDEWSETVFGS